MVSQLVLNSLHEAALTSLVAIGFMLVYQTGRFFHLGHALPFALAAYATVISANSGLTGFVLGVVIGILAATAVGALSWPAIFRPLGDRSQASTAQLLASLGLNIAGVNLLALLYGNDLLMLPNADPAPGLPILGARVTPVQASTLAVCGIAGVVAHLLIRHARFGRLIRAISSSRDLAAATGVRVDQITTLAFAMGSSLAALAGVLELP